MVDAVVLYVLFFLLGEDRGCELEADSNEQRVNITEVKITKGTTGGTKIGIKMGLFGIQSLSTTLNT